MRKLLISGLIAAPVFYYIGLFAGAATYPGYDHMTRYASELGAADAPYPIIFNASIIACGVAAIIGAFGAWSGLRALTGRGGWAVATAVLLGLWGVAMIMGGAFPMPDERHGAFGLGLVAPLIPLFALIAIAPVPRATGMKLFLSLVFGASIILLAIMMGVGGLVRVENVGAWQRLNSGSSIPWLAVFGVWLLQATGRPLKPSASL